MQSLGPVWRRRALGALDVSDSEEVTCLESHAHLLKLVWSVVLLLSVSLVIESSPHAAPAIARSCFDVVSSVRVIVHW